ncbi:MAG TPA: hypothetical protein V6C57_16765 [Coleofasciculaceae cyanobacterium]
MFRQPGDSCPWCDRFLNAVTSISEDATAPKPGDVSVCFGCGGLLEFNKSLKVEKIKPETIADLQRNDPQALAELLAAQAARNTLKIRGN